jgi:hypothetical protein
VCGAQRIGIDAYVGGTRLRAAKAGAFIGTP